MSPRVSVIVAVYQSEKYLTRCVDSILRQSFSDFELLLIDDGSTDNSPLICDENVRKDNRVRVIHKQHSGLADSRQCGFDNALGEYIINCDSDDWIEPYMLLKLYQKAKEINADMVVCDFVEEYPNHSNVYREFPLGFDYNKSIIMQSQCLSFSLCNKLIRRSFIEQHSIKCLQGVSYAEDMYFTFQILNNNPKTAYIPMSMYHYYRTMKDSLVNNFTLESLKSHRKVIEALSGIERKELLVKLDTNKCGVLLTTYKNRLLSKSQLQLLYPEAQEQILYDLSRNKEYRSLAMELFGYKLLFHVPLILRGAIEPVFRGFLYRW